MSSLYKRPIDSFIEGINMSPMENENYYDRWEKFYKKSRSAFKWDSETQKKYNGALFKKWATGELPKSEWSGRKPFAFVSNKTSSYETDNKQALSSLVHVLVIPPCKKNCKLFGTYWCDDDDCKNFYNASSLIPQDIPMLQKMKKIGTELAMKKWPQQKKRVINFYNNNKILRNYYNVDKATNDSTKGGLDLSWKAAVNIYNRLNNGLDLEPNLFYGFHLSKSTSMEEDNFSVGYLHLHVFSMTLLTEAGEYNFYKTCPYSVVLDTLTKLKNVNKPIKFGSAKLSKGRRKSAGRKRRSAKRATKKTKRMKQRRSRIKRRKKRRSTKHFRRRIRRKRSKKR